MGQLGSLDAHARRGGPVEPPPQHFQPHASAMHRQDGVEEQRSSPPGASGSEQQPAAAPRMLCVPALLGSWAQLGSAREARAGAGSWCGPAWQVPESTLWLAYALCPSLLTAFGALKVWCCCCCQQSWVGHIDACMPASSLARERAVHSLVWLNTMQLPPSNIYTKYH